MAIVSETGYSWVRSHSSSSSYTAGYTETVTFNIPSSSVTIRTALLAQQTSNQGPFGAGVGLVSVAFSDKPPLAFGSDHTRWAGIMFGNVRSFVVGIFVARGVMAGSVSMQVWG